MNDMRAALFLILLLIVSIQAHGEEVALKEIIAHPKQFDGREVTTKGLAALGGMGGNALYLYPDFATAAKEEKGDHLVYVPDRLMKFKSFSMEDHRCWFAVSGIVRARRHGPGGDIPCEIEIKSIRKLGREKRVLWPMDFGVFRNATSIKVWIDSELSDGGSTGTEVSPHHTSEIEISSRGVISVEDGSVYGAPKTIFKSKVQLPSRKPQEPSERSFHFIIHEDHLEATGPAKVSKQRR